MTMTSAASRAVFFARQSLSRFVRFGFYVLNRCNDDGCLAAAGALSYTTLVSLVPLLAISLAVFSAFPIFDKVRGEVLSFVFDAFVPRIGGTVEGYIATFAASAGKTTALGVVVLAVTAIMLLATIEARLDAIWRVHAPRGWIARITIYWTLLTFGPLIFGAAFSISTSLHLTAAEWGVDDAALPILGRLPALVAWAVPVVLQSLGLTLFYCLIPHCSVRWRDGLLGGVVAGLLLEICRGGFTLFIDHYNSYEPIYGALAVIPIFLLWMYLSWAVVLFGAEIAAAVPLWGIDEALGDAPETTDLELALRLLEALSAQIRRGGTARLRSLARQARASTGIVGDCLSILCTAGFVAATLDD
ncbi:MAG: YihY family inner membrane protein, partial [Aliidongia sp.]